MKKDTDVEGIPELRQKAESMLDPRPEVEEGLAGMSPQDIAGLVNELRVHQIELRMQNDELRRIQAELEKTRDRYAHLYDFAPVAYFTIDDKGTVEAANLTAAALLGRQRSALAGRLFSRFVQHDDQDTWYLHRKRLFETGEFQSFDLRLAKKGGAEFYVNLECMPIEENDSGSKQIRVAAIDITKRKQAEQDLEKLAHELEGQVRDRTEELNRRAEQLSILSSRLILTEQRERRRIAEILHDHLQQLMVGAKMGQEFLIRGLDDAQKQEAGRVLDLISQSIESSRFLTAELSPPVLQSNDFSACLEWLTRWMAKTYGFEVKLRTNGRIKLDHKDVTLLLFQSVRELLFNVLKHAGVKEATVNTKLKNGELRIDVGDRGAGFDPENILNGAGSDHTFGLISIRERMTHLGGRFEIESGPDRGTAISLIVPLEEGKKADSRLKNLSRKVSAKPVSLKIGTPRDDGKIRVMLVDDHSVLRESLSRVLGSYPDIAIAGVASEGEEAVHLAHEIVPDVILMDINMPKMNGLEATRRIHSEFPHIRIIGLSVHEEDDQAAAMLKAGASAYRSKTDDIELLLSTIRGN